MLIKNIAFYQFVSLGNDVCLRTLKNKLLTECNTFGLKGTILLAQEGINGFLAGKALAVDQAQHYLNQLKPFQNLTFKTSFSAEVPFRRMFVKIKKEIIPMGLPKIRPDKKTGKRVSAIELKKWLDEGKGVTLIDTRNTYETEMGSFKNAKILGIRHFREFPKKLDEIQSELLGEQDTKPIVMFCTGGIRCEKATAFAIQKGLQNVYQLDGGILKYFEECGGAHFEGDCFVFDQRIALNSDLEARIAVKG